MNHSRPVFLLLLLSWMAPAARAQVNANFSSNVISGCQPLTVSFSDLSSGGPTSWNWSFGNGNTSTLQNPTATYNTPNTYTVTLTVSNGSSSNTITRTAYITVFANPAAGFTITPATVCVGSNVAFTDTSHPGSGAINRWRWTFGDGYVIDSTLSNVSHTYALSSNFPVSLIIHDVHGCSHSAIRNILVNPGPLAAFTANPVTFCTAPQTVTFTNQSSGSATGYFWDFGDGNSLTSSSSTVTHQYMAPGSYTVTLYAISAGCTDTLIKANYVNIIQMNAAINGDTSICAGDSASFQDASSPAASVTIWNFGDPASGVNNFSTLPDPKHRYPNPGTYSVTLYATANGCSDSIIKTIVVHPNPTVNFSVSDSVGCALPFTVTFNDLSVNGGAAWHWQFGDGTSSALANPVHSYLVSGSYTVILNVTNSFGCSAADTVPSLVTVYPPVASFISTPDSGCVPLHVTFVSASFSLEPVIYYIWNFGNGIDTAAGAMDTNTYSSTGIYTVILTIVTQSGCIDSLIVPDLIRVGTPPTANFSWTPDTICYGQTVQFTDLSDSADAWFWLFGDGGASHEQNPGYQYQDTGLYTVQLIAYNNGCTDTVTYIDIIRVLPPAPFYGYQLNCANPYSVAFTDLSKGADSVVWDFGDGTVDTSNAHAPVHVYATRGIKFVTIITYNYSAGCSYAFTNAFRITDPVALFSQSPVYGCYPLTVTFADTSQDANSRAWDFDDPASGVNNYSYAPNPVHTFNMPGYYSVRLTITDVHGCIDTLRKTVHVVGPLPGLAVNNTSGCAPLAVLFTDTTLSELPVIQRHWIFGDGDTATTAAVQTSHTYVSPGNFTIILTVTDSFGCTATDTAYNMIRPTMPHPVFSSFPHFACPGQVLAFSAAGTSAVNPVYHWNFGDSATFSSGSPLASHSYVSEGTFVVTLLVTDVNGCDSTIVDTVQVLTPHANYSTHAVDSCTYTKVDFIDLTTGQPASWFWILGNGGLSTQQNPSHTYYDPGYYTVTLIVTNVAGCRDTITLDSIVVVPGPTGNFTFAPDSGCNPLTVHFSGTSINALFYDWDFGDGTVIEHTQQDTITHTYTHDQVTTPYLHLGYTLPSGQSCRDTASNLTGVVRVITYMTVQIDSSLIVIDEGEQVLLGSSVYDSIGGAPFFYSWTPSQLVTCASCPSTTVMATGTSDTTALLLTVTDNLGCEATDSVWVISIPCELSMFIPNVFTPNGDGYNDHFFIEQVCRGGFHFTIYNRVGSSRVDLQACKLEYSIVSPK